MEGVIGYKYRNLHKYGKLKEEVAERDSICGIKDYQLDHIFPVCLGGSDELENLQLLKIKEHGIKTGKDRKIINQLLKEGYIERVTYYLMQLNRPLAEIKKEYFKRLDQLDQLDRKSK